MPPPRSILDTIRSSCQRVANLTKDVSVDQEALQQLAASLDPAEVLNCAHGLHLPVKFDNKEAEITFLALYHLLNFGSGYDTELLRRYKRDSQEILQYAMLGMHMGTSRLDVQWMTTFNAGTVSSQFGIDSHEDQAVQGLPGVTMSKAGVLAPLVSLLTQSVKEAGQALQEEGASSVGQAILSLLDGLHKKKSETPAAALVQELVDAVPAFIDQGLYEGDKVVFARKAQGLVFDLYSRFHKDDPRFDFKDVAQLTGDSGATVAAVLRAKGVLRYSEELSQAVDQGAEIPAGLQERAIRAVTVCTVDALSSALGQSVTPAHVSAHLQYLAEPNQPLHGQIRKHITKKTGAY